MLPRVALEYGQRSCDEVLRRGLVERRDVALERQAEAEAALAERAEVDARGDGHALHVLERPLAARGRDHRVGEARRVAGREQLLGVGARAAVAAQLLRDAEV